MDSIKAAIKRGLARRESKFELRAAKEREAEVKTQEQVQHLTQLEGAKDPKVSIALPFRAAPKRGLNRRSSKLELRATSERGAEVQNHESIQHPAHLEGSTDVNMDLALPSRAVPKRALTRAASRLGLRAAYEADAEPKIPEAILRATRSQQQLSLPGPEQTIRATKSRAHLRSISTDETTKHSLKKRVTIANLRPTPEDKIPRAEPKPYKIEEPTAEEWGHIETFMRDKAEMKEMDKGMNTVNLHYFQTAEDIIASAALQHQGETTEEILQTLTVDNVAIIVQLGVSFKAAMTEVAVAADVMVLVNHLPDISAFSTRMKKQYSATQGVRLLHSREPERWLFRSRLGNINIDELAVYGGKEYSKACLTGDVEAVYQEFLKFLFAKGKREAGEGIRKERSALKLSKAMRKDRLEYDNTGRKRELREVRAPTAVFVYGNVDIFV